MIKRLIAVLLMIVTVLSAAACSPSENTESKIDTIVE